MSRTIKIEVLTRNTALTLQTEAIQPATSSNTGELHKAPVVSSSSGGFKPTRTRGTEQGNRSSSRMGWRLSAQNYSYADGNLLARYGSPVIASGLVSTP
jgi:hypothetical protein